MVSGILKLAALVVAFFLAVFLAFQLLNIDTDFRLESLRPRSQKANPTKQARHKCGLSKACPSEHFTFKIASGAASVVGPRMCLEDILLMSSVKNNVGRGINIALVNGNVISCTRHLSVIWNFYRCFSSFAALNLISSLGSSVINALGFRDNWIFVGGKGIRTKSPFEQHIKNSPETNKFDGWPEVLEMEGCVP
ncbi:unnamed protein product, partial [Tetraodon nigroviridis]